jgi:transposase
VTDRRVAACLRRALEYSTGCSAGLVLLLSLQYRASPRCGVEGSRGPEPLQPACKPTDRGKRGSKLHLVVDGAGVPLAMRHTAANVHDSRMLEELVDAVVPIRQPKGSPGRPRKRPEKLHADKGYDYRRCRETLHERGIKARISRRSIDTSERLGRHRWVMERTLAWLGRYRRLKVRYERRADIHQAFLSLGCALVCWNFLQRFC